MTGGGVAGAGVGGAGVRMSSVTHAVTSPGEGVVSLMTGPFVDISITGGIVDMAAVGGFTVAGAIGPGVVLSGKISSELDASDSEDWLDSEDSEEDSVDTEESKAFGDPGPLPLLCLKTSSEE